MANRPEGEFLSRDHDELWKELWKKWEKRLEEWAQRNEYLLEPGETPLDVVHDFLVEKGSRLAEMGACEGTVIVAFRNWLISRYRRRKRRPRGEPLAFPRLATPPPAGDHSADSLTPRLRSLEIMRSIAHGRGSKVDQGAVLLLQERTHAVLQAVKVDGITVQDAIDLAERLYPWTADDEARRPRRDLRTIGELWPLVVEALLAGRLEKAAHLAACVGVNAAGWAKWLERARKSCLRKFGHEEIRTCFPHWPNGPSSKGRR